MDLYDRELDSLMGLALQPIPVSTQQKHLAWERLQRQVVKQPMLPPVVAARPWWLAVFCSVRQSIYQFFMEEKPYEQAQYGRHAFGYTSLAIDSARWAAEVMGPLRFSAMYQMC